MHNKKTLCRNDKSDAGKKYSELRSWLRNAETEETMAQWWQIWCR